MAVKDSESRMVLMKKINGCSVLKPIVNKYYRQHMSIIMTNRQTDDLTPYLDS